MGEILSKSHEARQRIKWGLKETKNKTKNHTPAPMYDLRACRLTLCALLIVYRRCGLLSSRFWSVCWRVALRLIFFVDVYILPYWGGICLGGDGRFARSVFLAARSGGMCVCACERFRRTSPSPNVLCLT